jgi:Tfp pilus assembly protein PilF
VNRYVQTSSSSTPVIPNAPLPGTFPAFLSGIRELPESNSSDANRLEADARSAMGQGDRSAALSGFKRVVEADPKFTRAWLELAIVYMTSGQSDSALDALRKAIDSDPKQVVARKIYAFVLTGLRRVDAAMDAWRETLKIAPEDPEAYSGLGTLLMQQKRYSESVPYLETAAKNDKSPAAQYRLGSAYLRGGQIERGTTILKEARPFC